jgi:hypothetical protein
MSILSTGLNKNIINNDHHLQLSFFALPSIIYVKTPKLITTQLDFSLEITLSSKLLEFYHLYSTLQHIDSGNYYEGICFEKIHDFGTLSISQKGESWLCYFNKTNLKGEFVLKYQIETELTDGVYTQSLFNVTVHPHPVIERIEPGILQNFEDGGL